jgi:hypothetical protein
MHRAFSNYNLFANLNVSRRFALGLIDRNAARFTSQSGKTSGLECSDAPYVFVDSQTRAQFMSEIPFNGVIHSLISSEHSCFYHCAVNSIKMKTLLTIFALLTVGLCTAQQAVKQENPPSMADQDFSIREMAELQAFEIQKVCGIDDKADMSEVLKACYEFELDNSMESNRGNDQAMIEISERMDEAIRKVLGNQKMAAYQEWKVKPKAYSSDGYVD